MLVRCQRCNKEAHYLEKCNYCERQVCRTCVKSSRRPIKIERIVICKDCWSDLRKRKKYKSA